MERYVVNLFTFLLIYFSIYFSNFFVSISKPFQSLTSHFKLPNTVCLASFLRITFSYFSERILIFLFFFYLGMILSTLHSFVTMKATAMKLRGCILCASASFTSKIKIIVFGSSQLTVLLTANYLT